MESRDLSALISTALIDTIISGSPVIFESKLKKRNLIDHKHRCDEILNNIGELESCEIVRVVTSVLYEIVTNTPTEEILSRIALKTRGEAYSVNANVLAIDFIKYGAGNRLMKDLFNYSCKTCQRERKLYDVCFTGRFKNLDEEQGNVVIELLNDQDISKVSELRSFIYVVMEKTGYEINSIYKFLVEYQEQEKIVSKINGERLNERNRNWF